jgi:wee1-like protein kinase
VKRTEKKLQTEREKLEALREVQAMASLGGGGEHVVRYFGAWMEYDHLYIQVRHA